MRNRKMLHQVNRGISPFPNNLCKKIIISEYFIANLFKILLFAVVY